MDLTGREAGKRAILLGNEAIVRGALEAGVSVATAYPGTPSSEIADTFCRIADGAGIYFEYSTNEKVALEVAAGAAYSGARALVSMKHVGVNVALEPLMSLAYTGVPGGLVVITADEPGCHSSQNEQDNRLLARLANLPCLEPATADEARRLTKRAFALSERFELPVLLRTTTRISHSRGVVELGPLQPPKTPDGFEKNFRRYVTMPPVSLKRHGALLETMQRVETAVDEIEKLAEHSEHAGDVGVVSNGASRNYVHDALRELSADDSVDHLELMVTHPLPGRRCLRLLENNSRVLVVEELEPVIEGELKRLVAEQRLATEVVGKSFGELSRLGEYTPGAVRRTVAEFLGRSIDDDTAGGEGIGELPGRPPALCAGCPHRSSFFALRTLAGPDAIFAGDIGCYTLGGLEPFGMQDTLLCMGASTGVAGGLRKTNPDRPVVATIGDSTFFHSGIAGLVNAVRNGHNYTLAILDNSITAMTGHQPHPATDDGNGPAVSIEEVVRAIGVDRIEVVDPMDLPDFTERAQKCIDAPGVSVLICREPCPLYQRSIEDAPDERVVYRVEQDRCKSCGFAAQGLHCNVSIQPKTQRWRSDKKIDQLDVAESPPVRETVPPCSEGCPVNICVHGYVANVAAGDYAAALKTIRERNPLPSVCSRVCHSPCETACHRSDYDGAVEINRLKRFVCDWATEHADEVAPPSVDVVHPERIAVIGAGPCGLACAHDLALRGYSVTVFDQMPRPGGLLRYGIPPYRLPDQILDRDLEWIAELGVEFRCGVDVGGDVTLPELANRGFDAFALATGAWNADIPDVIDGAVSGVHDALGFLRELNSGNGTSCRSDGDDTPTGNRTIVVGAGNTGIDAARCSLRLGSNRVTVVERNPREECGAIAGELQAAEAEGVEFLFDTEIVDLSVDGDEVAGLKLRLSDASVTELSAQSVMVATGQQPAPSHWVPLGLAGEDGWLATDDTGATRLPGVFAAGDAAEGPGHVIDVIAAGRRIAHRIDDYLAAGTRSVAPLHFHDPDFCADEPDFEPEDLPHNPPVEPTGPENPTGSFEPPHHTLSESLARQEANRCMGCGSCANCNVCIDDFACVAIYRDEHGRVRVNESLCTGCGVCAQLCPNNAYRRVVLESGR